MSFKPPLSSLDKSGTLSASLAAARRSTESGRGGDAQESADSKQLSQAKLDWISTAQDMCDLEPFW